MAEKYLVKLKIFNTTNERMNNLRGLEGCKSYDDVLNKLLDKFEGGFKKDGKKRRHTKKL